MNASEFGLVRCRGFFCFVFVFAFVFSDSLKNSIRIFIGLN